MTIECDGFIIGIKIELMGMKVTSILIGRKNLVLVTVISQWSKSNVALGW